MEIKIEDVVIKANEKGILLLRLLIDRGISTGFFQSLDDGNSVRDNIELIHPVKNPATPGKTTKKEASRKP